MSRTARRPRLWPRRFDRHRRQQCALALAFRGVGVGGGAAARVGDDPAELKSFVLALQYQYTSTVAMFKKELVSHALCLQTQGLISASLTPGAKSKVKSSAQRAIRAKAIETYPRLEPYMDEIMPKKEQIDLVKVYVDL